MANELMLVDENINPIFEEIRGLINNSRNRVYNTVNTEMLNLYWNIGKIIMEIQQGNERATYGDAVLEKLSEKLTNEFGKGFMFVGSQVRLTLEEDHFYPDRNNKINDLTDINIDEIFKSSIQSLYF